MLKKLISILISTVLMVSLFTNNAIAISRKIEITEAKATNCYAYSIGVNHGNTNSGLTGNFIPNVKYANTCYGMINGISSYYNDRPTISYMKGNNPSGNRRIASRVVWLNGHANNTTLVFNHNNLGGNYNTGVYYGYDTSNYVGLLSTSMSGVDLISFVGCQTAKGQNNLASRARSQGATTAIGFRESITSRSSDGQGWCRKFNDALSIGHTISSAISYATSFYPNADLDNYIKVYGSTTNKISQSGNVSSLSTGEQWPGNRILNTNITYNNIGIVENEALIKYSKELSNIINTIIIQDKSFNTSDYSISANMYSDDGKSGIVTLTYNIGEIVTNKAYIITVENNTVTNIVLSHAVSSNKSASTMTNQKNLINEKYLISLVEKHKSQNSVKYYNNKSNIIDVRKNYYFDYSTNKLTYQKCVYCIAPNSDNVIIDFVSSEVINNN